MICDRGEGHPERDTRGRKADRAQGLGHRLRNSQAQTLPLSHFGLLVCMLLMPNQAASVDAPITSLFAFESQWWRAPEQRRWVDAYE